MNSGNIYYPIFYGVEQIDESWHYLFLFLLVITAE